MTGRLPRFACTLLALWLAAAPAGAAPLRVLFDNAHGEQAGNADWVIDDQQPTPAPPQSGIGRATPGTYWSGAISTWGVELARRGCELRTNAQPLTHGNARNALDLSRFDVLVIPEPNRPFSAAEAAAILRFVREGGGLVAVGDHHRSDRDRDGYDSPRIWNALDPARVLGVRWGSKGDEYANVTQRSRNVNPDAESGLRIGPAGAVRGLEFHNGTTLVLDPAANATVRAIVWMQGAPRFARDRVMAASARYGKGRVVFIGDSSVVDDGSANSGNTNIYDGWNEAGGSNGTLALNATLWVAPKH